MASWPEALRVRAWLRDGYRLQPVNHIARTQKTSGRARQRRVVSCSDVVVSAACIFESLTELDTFLDFFDTDLNGGADEFTGPFWDGGGMRDATMEIVDGKYNTQRINRNITRIEFQLLIKDRVQVHAALINDLLDGNIQLGEYLAVAKITGV